MIRALAHIHKDVNILPFKTSKNAFPLHLGSSLVLNNFDKGFTSVKENV